MLTKNGKVLLTQSIDSSGRPIDRTFIDTGGGPVSTGHAGYGTGKNMGQVVEQMCVAVGSGTTNPTADDYCLEQVVNSLTVLSSTNSGNRTASYEDNYMHSCSRTYKNNTNSPITISEIGAITPFKNYSGGNMGTFLFAREVITPVTIQPGATYTFSITVG